MSGSNGEETPQWRRDGTVEGSSRTFKRPRVRLRRSSKDEAGRTHSELTTKSGQVRRAQKGLFVHYCDICSKGPYSRREHLNRHKKRHFDLTRKCRVCGKIFQEDDYLQKHLKKMHPDLVELSDLKTESSCADGEPRVKIEPQCLPAEPANVNRRPRAGHVTFTCMDEHIPCQTPLITNARLSPSRSPEPDGLSPGDKYTKPSDSMTERFHLTNSGAIEQVEDSAEQDYSSKGTSSKKPLHYEPYRKQNSFSRSAIKQDTLNWPFSQCQHPATALLRGLVCDFSSIYGKEWMGELFAINSRPNEIDQSLFAVTAMWQSRIKRDRGLRRNALTVYQGAILSVREQLATYRLNQPFILVAISMIFAATEAQVDDGVNQVGWVTHIKGALAVLGTTDPQIWTSVTHIRLYIDLRYMALLAFLASRKPCFFAQKKWRGLVRPSSFGTIRETLIDELVDLPELLSICATLENEMRTTSVLGDEAALLQVWRLLEAFSRFEMRLKIWFQGLQSHASSPPYWPKYSPNSMPLSSEEEVPIAIWFSKPLKAETITLYWASRLLIYLSIIDLYESSLPKFHVRRNPPKSSNPEISGHQRIAISSDDVGVYDAETDISRYWPPSEADARQIATMLGQSLEYMMSDAFKPLNGARLACVPLWPAIRFFSRYQLGPELQWCSSVAEHLSEKTGLMYVSKVANNSINVTKHWNSE